MRRPFKASGLLLGAALLAALAALPQSARAEAPTPVPSGSPSPSPGALPIRGVQLETQQLAPSGAHVEAPPFGLPRRFKLAPNASPSPQGR